MDILSLNLKAPYTQANESTVILNNLSNLIPNMPAINNNVKRLLKPHKIPSTLRRHSAGDSSVVPSIEVIPPSPSTPNENKLFEIVEINKVFSDTLDLCKRKIRRFSEPSFFSLSQLGVTEAKEFDGVRRARRKSMPCISSKHLLQVPKPDRKKKRRRRLSLPENPRKSDFANLHEGMKEKLYGSYEKIHYWENDKGHRERVHEIFIPGFGNLPDRGEVEDRKEFKETHTSLHNSDVSNTELKGESGLSKSAMKDRPDKQETCIELDLDKTSIKLPYVYSTEDSRSLPKLPAPVFPFLDVTDEKRYPLSSDQQKRANDDKLPKKNSDMADPITTEANDRLLYPSIKQNSSNLTTSPHQQINHVTGDDTRQDLLITPPNLSSIPSQTTEKYNKEKLDERDLLYTREPLIVNDMPRLIDDSTKVEDNYCLGDGDSNVNRLVSNKRSIKDSNISCININDDVSTIGNENSTNCVDKAGIDSCLSEQQNVERDCISLRNQISSLKDNHTSNCCESINLSSERQVNNDLNSYCEKKECSADVDNSLDLNVDICGNKEGSKNQNNKDTFRQENHSVANIGNTEFDNCEKTSNQKGNLYHEIQSNCTTTLTTSLIGGPKQLKDNWLRKSGETEAINPFEEYFGKQLDLMESSEIISVGNIISQPDNEHNEEAITGVQTGFCNGEMSPNHVSAVLSEKLCDASKTSTTRAFFGLAHKDVLPRTVSYNAKNDDVSMFTTENEDTGVRDSSSSEESLQKGGGETGPPKSPITKSASLTGLDVYNARLKTPNANTDIRTVSLHEDAIADKLLLDTLSSIESPQTKISDESQNSKQTSASMEELDDHKHLKSHRVSALNRINKDFAHAMLRKAVSLVEIERIKENVAKFEQKFLSTEVLSAPDNMDEHFPRLSMEDCSKCASCRSRSSSYHSLLYDLDTANLYPIYQPTVIDFTEEEKAEFNAKTEIRMNNNAESNINDSDEVDKISHEVSPVVEDSRTKMLKAKKERLMKQGQAAFGSFKEKFRKAKAKV